MEVRCGVRIIVMRGSDSETEHKGATFYFTLPVADMIEERGGETS